MFNKLTESLTLTNHCPTCSQSLTPLYREYFNAMTGKKELRPNFILECLNPECTSRIKLTPDSPWKVKGEGYEFPNIKATYQYEGVPQSRKFDPSYLTRKRGCDK